METKIRIEEDDNDHSWFAIQKRTFFKWCNTHLAMRDMQINQVQDLSNGVLIINLLEQITGKTLGNYNKKPRMRIHRLENASIALNFLKAEGFKLVGIAADDIVDGMFGLICGLIWMLIVRYQIQVSIGNTYTKAALLSWVQKQIPEYNISNFRSDWVNGKALCALINSVEPNSIDMSSLDEESSLKCAQIAASAAEGLGIPPILSPEDLTSQSVDDLSLLTYLSYFKNYAQKQQLV